MTLLPMENKETILCALKCFEKEKSNNIPPILDDYIKQIAKNGQTMLPWIYVKPLMLCKYNKVMDSFLSEYTSEFMPVSPNPAAITELRQQVYNTLKRLDGIPFTIQRLCELLENPFRHYTRPDKFLRGLEKVLMVVSTVDPQGNKIHREDPRFPSQAGMDECSMIINDTLMSPPVSPQPDNVHGAHTSKSSDEDITEDENVDENEDDEEGEEGEDRGGTDDDAGGLTHTDRVSPAQAMPTLSKVGPPVPNWSIESKLTTRLGLPVSPSTNANDHAGKVDEQNTDLSSKTVAAAPLPPNANVSPDRNSVHLSTTTLVGATPVSLDSAPGPLDSCSQSPGEKSAEGEEDHTASEHRLSGDTVPPIRQILRPIGQLEAFVQNMAADIPNAPASTTPSLVSSPSANESDPTTGSPKTADPPATELASGLSSPMTAQKRRAPLSPPSPSPTTSSDSVEANSDDSVDSSSNEPLSLESLQSPAKRRRLGNTHVPPQSQQHSSDSSASGSEAPSPFPNSLNSSPPIILCNPSSNPSRDRESGECLASGTSTLAADVTHEAQAPPPVLSARLDDRSTDVRGGTTDTAPSLTASSTVRIDMETGEEEEAEDQEMDEGGEDDEEQGTIEGEADRGSEIRSSESSS